MRRLFEGDHPRVAMSLNNLGHFYWELRRPAEAEGYFRDAVEMYRRVYKGDHADLALGLNNLGAACNDQGKLPDAERWYRDALDMFKRMHRGNHPDVALALNNLGMACSRQGRLAEAEDHARAAVDMYRALDLGDHPRVAFGLTNLAGLLHTWGKLADAEGPAREALAMNRRLLVAYARQKSEGEALSLLPTLPLSRATFLTIAVDRQADPAAVYAEVWADKAALARVYEHRQLSACAAATGPDAARVVADLADARRRRAELLLAPAPKDPAVSKKRDDDLAGYAGRIETLDADLRKLLPTVGRADRLARATPADLQRELPPDTVFVDFLAYTRMSRDPGAAGPKGDSGTRCYAAFVVSRDAVRWIDLGPAKPVEDNVGFWLDAITGPTGRVPADLPGRVRDLVWAKVRAAFPTGTRRVYVAPDLALTGLPWVALPGDRPGTVVLEEFAVGVVPHGPALLDGLWAPDAAPAADRARALVVGGVDFGPAPAPVAGAGPKAWVPLPGAKAEAEGVAALARGRNLDPRVLAGADATADRVLGELPRVRVAHLATHGFYAPDPTARKAFDLDERLFAVRGGERVGPAARSPLVQSGLVLAGANRPDTPGRGLVTGEALVDRDLSGLDLAVLSACETGRGEAVAAGEGAFGLQRAFHVAGCRNVVAGLWKVDDDATAALMAEFYRNLWGRGLDPLDALREAQLALYRNPGQIPKLGEGFRQFGTAKSPAVPAPAAVPGDKAHPRLWAAFTLSGPGR
jgi:CHAT domain-containing protein/tetratricopeptide (TPR) repeat protein